MAIPVTFPAEVETSFSGPVSFGTAPQLPAGAIPNAAIASLAGIDASKLKTHRTTTTVHAAENVEPTTSLYHVVHLAQASGEVIGFNAMIFGTLSGTTVNVTVDLCRSVAGSTYASILSAPIALNNGASIRVPASGTLSATTFAAGSSLAVKVTAASSSAARGLASALKYWEAYS